MQRKAVIRPATITVLILLIPLILTLINPTAHLTGGSGGGWDWMPGDFVVMGALLFCAGLLYEFLASKVATTSKRVALGVVILIGVVAIWVELAVDAVSRAIQFFI